MSGTGGARGAPSATTERAGPGETEARGGAAPSSGGRAPAMRTDARRNLRHVLSAARDVFGEQGYEAPIEEVARRAQVGVGTVYRRFPNKDALVRYITEQETRRLTERALQALAGGGDPWAALEDFVRYAAVSGTSRLLPELFAAATAHLPESGSAAEPSRPVPSPRSGGPGGRGEFRGGAADGVGVPDDVAQDRVPLPRAASDGDARSVASSPWVPLTAPDRELLTAVGSLVERARSAGRLRPDATVADVMVVIATTPPVLTDPGRRSAVSERLLDILLRGLRPDRLPVAPD